MESTPSSPVSSTSKAIVYLDRRQNSYPEEKVQDFIKHSSLNSATVTSSSSKESMDSKEEIVADTRLRGITREQLQSFISVDSTPTDSEVLEEAKWLMPKKLIPKNLVTKELSEEQINNLRELEAQSQELIIFANTAYSSIRPITDVQATKIQDLSEKTSRTIRKITKIVEVTIDKGDKIKKTHFFETLIEQISPIISKSCRKQLDKVDEFLKDLLALNFKQLHRDKNVELFLKHLDKSIWGLTDKYNKDKSDLDKKVKEITILYEYRQVLVNLAIALEAEGSDFTFSFEDFGPQSVCVKNLFEQINTEIKKILHIFKEEDKEEFKLRELIPEKPNQNEIIRYKKLIYETVAIFIKTYLLEILWIEAFDKKMSESIRLYSDNLKKAKRPWELFYSDCIAEFEKSLQTRPYDQELLKWWTRMLGDGMVCYIDSENHILLKPKKIPLPQDSSTESILSYQKELKAYLDSSTFLLSFFVFGEKDFLTHFFDTLTKLRNKHWGELKTNNELEVHCENFKFLEFLQKNHNSAQKMILREFNEALTEIYRKSSDVMKRLDRIALKENQPYGVQQAISFMLEFYRAVDHRIMMWALSIIKTLYAKNFPHHDYGKVIRDANAINSDKKEDSFNYQDATKDTKRIYFVLHETYLEINSVRKDEIYPGEDVEETFCEMYTETKVILAFPGHPKIKDPHSIGYSYRKLKPQTEKSENEVAKINKKVDEKLFQLSLIINPANFPVFSERSDDKS